MKRLMAGLAILAVLALGAPSVWAQQVDPLHFGRVTPQALEGTFEAGAGQLAFLALAAPRGCADGSDPDICKDPVRVFFYDSACTKVDTAAAPLSQNGTTVLPIPGVTAATSGGFLVAKAPDINTPVGHNFSQDVLIGWLLQIDVNRGIARIEDLDQMSGDFGQGWIPFKTAAAVPFLPGDDGTSFLVTLIFRCPTGVAIIGGTNNLQGTKNTLGGDMAEVHSNGDRNRPIGQSYTPGTLVLPSQIFGSTFSATAANRPSNFATGITINVFDTNENPQATVTTTCQCRTEKRLSALFSGATTASSYLEIRGTAPTNLSGNAAGAFTGLWTVQFKSGATNLYFSDSFWRAPSPAFLDPTSF